jgi:uncharacterized membrane protein YidH (DUF202 family)
MRWLERCLLACRAKSWENALMEIECAKAEMDAAREELWAIAQDPDTAGRSGRALSRTVRAVFVAAMFVLATAVPLANSVIQVQDRAKAAVRVAPVLEWVTADERTLLAALRKSLSEANAGTTREQFVRTDAEVAEAELPSGIRKARYGVGKSNEGVAEGQENVASKPRSGMTGEKIYTLVQLGQRALRDSEPAIRIDRSDVPPESSRRK